MMDAPLSDPEVAAIRAQLPAIAGVAYMNAGSLGPMPLAAIAAMDAERDYDERTRQATDHWDRLTERQGRAREAITKLTGIDADRVALMHTTHEALNSCLWGMDLDAGDSVVTTDEEHPGLLVPLRHVRARRRVNVEVVPWCDDPSQFVDRIRAATNGRTRAVTLSHVSWVSGRVAPLRALRDALPAGVRLIVDGAQSAGVLEVDPSDGWDAYTVSGQKWPCGPNGSGGLALADPEAWLPTFGAYTQVTDYDDILHSGVVPLGRRLEQSQEALAPLAGLAASVRWLVDDIGIGRVQAHARACNERARSALERGGIDPSRLHGVDHLLVLDVDPGTAESTSAAVHAGGVLIRALGDARVRASFGCWNTIEEVDLLCSLLVHELT